MSRAISSSTYCSMQEFHKAGRSCCQSPIPTSYSRCPERSAPSPTRTRPELARSGGAGRCEPPRAQAYRGTAGNSGRNWLWPGCRRVDSRQHAPSRDKAAWRSVAAGRSALWPAGPPVRLRFLSPPRRSRFSGRAPQSDADRRKAPLSRRMSMARVSTPALPSKPALSSPMPSAVGARSVSFNEAPDHMTRRGHAILELPTGQGLVIKHGA